MRIQDTILFKLCHTNSKFKQFETVREVASFFLGILAIESRYTKLYEKGEAFWISEFESFLTAELNSELNSGSEQWTNTIGTSYANYLMAIQRDNEDGLTKFSSVLNRFIVMHEADDDD